MSNTSPTVIFSPSDVAPEFKTKNTSTILGLFAIFIAIISVIVPILSVTALVFSVLVYRREKIFGISLLIFSLCMTAAGLYYINLQNEALRLVVFSATVIVPFFLWFIFIRWLDRSEPEPLNLHERVFLFGVISSLFALGIETLIDFSSYIEFSAVESTTLAVIIGLFSAGIIEELVKYLLLRTAVYSEAAFNQIFDGVVYGMTVGLGFSIVENIHYFFSLCTCSPDYFVSSMVFRAIVTTLVHVTATGIMGYYLGKAKFQDKKYLSIMKGLILAIFVHGGYNLILLIPSFGALISVVYIFVIASAFLIRLNKADVRMVWKPAIVASTLAPIPPAPTAKNLT